jgi:hypothetical protein
MFPILCWRGIKRVAVWIKNQAVKLAKPLIRSGKGMAHYINLVCTKVGAYAKIVGGFLSSTLSHIGKAI